MFCSYHTVSLYIKVFFFCLFYSFWWPVSGNCEPVLDVTVTGVEGRLYDNIMARLRIYIYSRDSSLEAAEIKRLHTMAVTDITSALAPYGYYSAEVDSTLAESETGWEAAYHVDAGEPVTLSDVQVAVVGPGREVPELSDPFSIVGLKTGEVLDQPEYEKGKKRLIRIARSLGFLDADFKTREIAISKKDASASVTLVLETGQRYLFGQTVSDQDIITDELLYRFLPYSPGDYYSSSRLYQLQRDLYRTDYFGSVIVEGGTENPDGTYVPVTIRLEPQKHYNQYSFGVGYATDTRFHTLFEWQNKLFNKRGHRVVTSFLIGELDSYCTIGYKIPVDDPRFNTVAFSGTWKREEWEETTTSLLSAGAAYEYSTPAVNFGGSLELRNEDYNVGNTSGESLMLMPLVHWSWALADNVVNTTNGFRLTTTVSGAADNVVSDVSFVKGRADGKLILSPLDGWRLIGRGSIGGILVNSIDEIPPSLRFYAGGAKSVRGYRYKTLGPEDDSGTLVGGTFLLTGSIEGERRINNFLRFFAFYDVGNAMDDLAVDLASGIGGGLAVVLPFGHIRIELAYPLNNEGDAQYFYLNVGADL